MKLIVHALRLLKRNLLPLLAFEIIWRGITLFTLPSLVSASLRIILYVEKIPFISWENLPYVATRPSSLLMLFLAFVIFAFLTLFEINVIIAFAKASREDISLRFTSAIEEALKSSAKAVHIKNLLILPLTIIVLPLANISVAASFAQRPAIPEFVSDAIWNTPRLSAIYISIIVLINLLLMRLIFIFPLMNRTNNHVISCARASIILSRGQLLKNILIFIVPQLALVAAQELFSDLMSLLTPLIIFLDFPPFINQALIAIPLSLAFIFRTTLTIFAPLFAWTLVLCRFTQLCPSYPAKKKEAPEAKVERERRLKRYYLVYCLFCYVMIAVSFTVLTSNWALKRRYTSPVNIEIAAHRGDVTSGIENTFGAFNAALQEGADWIELDVQQSKDGIIYVAHDSSFVRLSGVPKYSWQLEYTQIAKLNKPGTSSDDRLYPTLYSVVKWAKANGIRLNIELKPTGHETDFEKDVIKIIHRLHMQDRVILTSMNYNCLKRLKAADPKIPRAYVMTLAFGDISKLDAADIFSVEETSCTQSFVRFAHRHGKQVLAWTVNDPSRMSSVMVSGADCIITDNLGAAMSVRDSGRTVARINDFMLKYLGSSVW